MKKMWVISAKGKALGLVDRVGGEYFHMSISEKMGEEKTPVEVPDDDFFNKKIQEGLLEKVLKKEKPKPKVVVSDKEETG